MKKLLATAVASLAATGALAQTEINGTVDSKCIVITETTGVFGNPSPNMLTTDPQNGGVEPIIRYDVALGDAYTAKITAPNSFSTSPSLSDVVSWTGDVEVNEVSDTAMADYETNKVQYEYTTEFDMHTAGTTWFKITSKAEYGYGKVYPQGTYRAIVMAECIAN